MPIRPFTTIFFQYIYNFFSFVKQTRWFFFSCGRGDYNTISHRPINYPILFVFFNLIHVVFESRLNKSCDLIIRFECLSNQLNWQVCCRLSSMHTHTRYNISIFLLNWRATWFAEKHREIVRCVGALCGVLRLFLSFVPQRYCYLLCAALGHTATAFNQYTHSTSCRLCRRERARARTRTHDQSQTIRLQARVVPISSLCVGWKCLSSYLVYTSFDAKLNLKRFLLRQ